MQIGIAMRASVLQCGQNWDVPGTAGTALMYKCTNVK